MRDFQLAKETLGYQTSTEPSNTDTRLLVGGSKNVLIDFQKKVKTRSGYTRLGAGNTALTPIRNAWTWDTSTGDKRPQRFYDDELEVYIGTLDTQVVDAWTRVKDAWSTTERMRANTWFDTGENLDLQIMVIGDANLYEWNGAVAAIDSVAATALTKKGTKTWAQSRFYTTRNKVVTIGGTDYTYTGGETTTTLTGVTPNPVTGGVVAGDIAVQKVITQSNKPASGHTNDIIYSFENQLVIGSYDDEEIYISQNDDYDDFTFSTPRVFGEGALLTLTDPCRGIASLGKKLVIGAGKSTMFTAEYEQITVSTTLAETLKIRKLDTGVNQGFLNQESIVPIGNAIAYLSNEIAVRIIQNPEDLTGINPKTFSNPIKPDFDAEDWYDSNIIADAFGIWYKNILIFSVPQASHLYMLNLVEDADGKLFRFWNPPQVLPAGPLALIDLDDGDGALLYGHSNGVPESYLLFDGASDGQFSGMTVEDKLPINAKAVFAYNNYKKRGILKTFDEYYVEGEITPNTTDLILTLKYDFDGATQTTESTIDGSDETILEGSVSFNALAH